MPTGCFPPFQPSRQDFHLAAPDALQHIPEFWRIQNLDGIAPLDEVPGHLQPAAGLELDQEAAIVELGQLLIWMEHKVTRR